MKYFLAARFALLALLSAVLLVQPVAAVEYGGIGGVPANPRKDNERSKSIFIYTLKQSAQKNDAIKLVNNTDSTHTLAVYPVDAVLASGGAFTCAQRADQPSDVGSWISLSSTTVTLAANETKTVPFTITVPNKADVGEHNGCIAIEDKTATAPQQEQSGVVLGFRSAIRVAITIPGNIVKSLALSTVGIEHLQNGNVLVKPAATNKGNVSLDTDLTTYLRPVLGVSSTTKNGSYPVLPSSTASWNFEIESPFWGGWYRADVAATYNNDPTAGIGSKDTSSRTVSKQSSVFFVAPQPLALVIELAVILLLLLLLWALLRRAKHRSHVRRHWQTYTVVDGDNINKIATKTDVGWKKIAKANKLKAPYHLEPGQTLKIPPTNNS